MKLTHFLNGTDSILVFRNKWFLITACAFLYIASRSPALFQELLPYTFCDENVYLVEVMKRLIDGSWTFHEFRAGGMNLLPMFIAGKLFGIKEATQITEFSIHGRFGINDATQISEFLIYGRFFYLIFIGGLTSVFLYKITHLITSRKSASFLAVALFIISPYCLSMARFWYPDHYIYFFSAGMLYYTLRGYKYGCISDYLYAGIFWGCAASVKYTGLLLSLELLLLPIAFAFSKKSFIKKEVLAYFYIRLSFSGLAFVVTFCLLNYSIFLDFNKFITDFMFNINNYGKRDFTDPSGVIFYLSLLYITFLTPLFTPFAAAGYYKLVRDNIAIFVLLLAFPIIYTVYMGSGKLVINRNVSILIPFVIPVFSIGLIEVAKFLKQKNKTLTYLAYGFIVFPLFAFALIVGSDFAKDSRVEAAEWIESHLPHDATFGINEFCSGLSPAQVAGNPVSADPDFSDNHDYYLINSYWNSNLSSLYWNRGLLQQLDQKYVHFYNFNDRKLWGKSIIHRLSIGFAHGNYRLIKIFPGNGPTLYLFERDD